MDVSIIIVNYNTCSLLEQCLTSIINQTKDISYETIVSDNNSHDGSIEMIKTKFASVKIIENNDNLGFGRANNRALDIAQGKYIFYLNSDTVLLNNAVKYFYDYFESHAEERIGALGCNLVDNNFKFTHSYGTFPVYKKEVTYFFINSIKLLCKHILLSIKLLPTKKNSIQTSEPYIGEVDYVTGADLFVKNNDFARFDERFFLYYEETDMQLNMQRHGLLRMIIEEPRIQHLCLSLNAPKNDIELEKSFSHIQSEKSSIIYFSKNKRIGNKSSCILLRVMIKLCWWFSGAKDRWSKTN